MGSFDIRIDDMVMEACRECVDENEEALEQDCREAGDRARKLLKERSRVNKKKNAKQRGLYAKSWTATTTSDETGVECVVHNRNYQLTHLLEKGHVIKNQTGKTYGSVSGDNVIEQVFNEVAAEFGGGAS